MARDILGEVEQLVLLAILRLGDEAYGVVDYGLCPVNTMLPTCPLS